MRVRLRRERLVEVMADSTMTQNHWAMRLGLSRGHLSEIVNGKHPYLSPRTREKLLVGLKMAFEELFVVETGDEWTHGSSADFQAMLADRYLIDRQLGRGGMGTVYLARDVKHGRLVAIKVISPEVVSGVGAEQFLKEVRFTSRLEHPNILSLHDSGEAAGYPFYIMPFIRGGSLAARLAEEGPLGLDAVVEIARDVGAALQFAHENRVIHCDLKPANILLAPNHAYLADFGISRAVHAEVRAWGRRGEIDSSAGTPAYVSPEQASGEPIDARTDVYSLGCVVFEMLAGRPAFSGSTTMEVVSKRFTAMVPNLEDVAPHVPVNVAAVVERSMQLESHRRPDTAAEFIDALERAAVERNPVREAVTILASRITKTVRRWAGFTSPAGHRPAPSRIWNMDRFIQDLRYAVRSLRRRPGFTAVAVLTLAIGIGANTAIFSVVNGIFLFDPGVTNEATLSEIARRERDGDYSLISRRDLEDIRDGATDVFLGVTTLKQFTAQVGGAAGPADVVLGQLVDGSYFDVLGVTPAAGRFFQPEEDQTPETHPVLVLSHRYWNRRFDGAPSTVGSTLRVNGRPYVVVGVAPREFRGMAPAVTPDLFAPMAMENHLFPSSATANNRGAHARLRPGVTAGQATAALAALSARIDDERGRVARAWEFEVVPYRNITFYPGLDGPLTAMAALLMTVVGLVLIITCVNLAGFLLARATDRRKEIAVRIALGANRVALVRQLLTESVLLGVVGGAAGLMVAVVAARALRGMEPAMPMPVSLDVGLDLAVLGFAAAVSVAAGVFFGLAPAVHASRADLTPALRDDVGLGWSGRHRFNLRNALVVIQMALSLVLLVGAGLFVRSLREALAIDVGFSTAPAAVIGVDARGSGYPADEWRGLYRRLTTALAGGAGVSRVAATTRIPLGLGIHTRGYRIPGVEMAPGREFASIEFAAVSPGYLDFMEIALVQGREFSAQDREGASPVAIVSRAAAAAMWPDGPAVGRVIRLASEPSRDVTIVGVAEDVKIRSLGESPRRYLYLPIAQEVASEVAYLIRGSAPAPQLVRSARDAVLAVDPNLFVHRAETLADYHGLAYFLPRMAAGLLTMFAVVAVVLASVGLYGVVSYAVARRTREMGIRISLGARAGDVVRLVMRGGLGLVVVGGTIGIVLAWVATRLIEGFLVGVPGHDPVTFAILPAVLLGVGVLSAYLPARRAARVRPTEALRSE